MRPGLLEKVVLALRRSQDKHILIGPLATEVGESLDETEEALEELVAMGKLRRVHPREMFRSDGVSAYAKKV